MLVNAWRIRLPFSSISTFHHAKQIYHEKERGTWRVEEGVAHSVDPTGSARRSTEERTLPDRFKRAFRPRRTCSSKLYETSLHASATSLSLPLFSAHVPFRTCACTWTCTYTRIYVYEYENGRCAEATLYLSLFIRQVEPSASLFIQSSCFRAERVSSRS